MLLSLPITQRWKDTIIIEEIKELKFDSQYISEKCLLVHHMYIKQHLSLFEGLQITQHC